MTTPDKDTTHPDADDWITHNGGPMPKEIVAEVKLRSGNQFSGDDLSDNRTWAHIWGESDIIAYRLAAPTHPESGELRIEGYRAFNTGIGHERLVDRPSANDSNPRPLADHATATRLLAERDARIKQLEASAGLLDTENGDLEATNRDLASRLSAAEAEVERLRGALSTALGYMRNARIDLETGATKATAIRTISGGISRTEAALTPKETT